jgi:phosphohistidine swiveling domain-containing protein
LTTELATETHFDPPGPGFWQLDAVHFPRAVTRYWAEMHPEPFARGSGDFMRYYGILLERLGYEYINGFGYKTAVPVADEDVAARFQRAEEVFEGKLWRDQLREWDETFKPASIATHKELQSVDPDALSDEELVGYLTRCRDHHAEMIYQHMRHTGAAIVPMGDFLAHVGDWTGLPPAELLGLMRGAAPVSAGASAELERLRESIAEDPAARELLESEDDPGDVLERLRSLDSDAGRAADAYLGLVGNRLVHGFDISNPYALELPASLLQAIRVAVGGEGLAQSDVDERVTAVRNKVPEEHRSEFDELLEEARHTYRIRDERGVFSDIWASGIMRRAALAAGRRLVNRGRITEAEHFIDAGFDEMCSLLASENGPSADELAERFQLRRSASAKAVPAHLGTPPPPPPEPSGLPPAAARVMRATGIVMGEMFQGSQEEHEGDVLRGLAASPGVYEGPARRVTGPEEFSRITQGDVLVTESTSEAFNILLPLLGAIVTDSGGLLSHAAIVAREYGIPGVVGTRDGTDHITDGERVRVDGDTGRVAVLGW